MLFGFNLQDSHALVGVQEDDACVFESSSHLIARGLIDLESIWGFEALERGQRDPGLVSERLLCPTQQRARGPKLSGGDHA